VSASKDSSTEVPIRQKNFGFQFRYLNSQNKGVLKIREQPNSYKKIWWRLEFLFILLLAAELQIFLGDNCRRFCRRP
jgi:hypothetical protein